MPRIFVNYRREDAAGHARLLYQTLAGEFGAESVFMDIDTLELGEDFVERVDDAVGECDALIAVIGHNWLSSTDRAGQRRLDHPDDFVRLEIASALERKVRVIPVLVHGGIMPLAEELPDDLKGLVRRHALELSDNYWNYGVEQLVANLQRIQIEAPPKPKGEPTEPPTREAPAQLDQPAKPTRQKASTKPQKDAKTRSKRASAAKATPTVPAPAKEDLSKLPPPKLPQPTAQTAPSPTQPPAQPKPKARAKATPAAKPAPTPPPPAKEDLSKLPPPKVPRPSAKKPPRPAQQPAKPKPQAKATPSARPSPTPPPPAKEDLSKLPPPTKADLSKLPPPKMSQPTAQKDAQASQQIAKPKAEARAKATPSPKPPLAKEDLSKLPPPTAPKHKGADAKVEAKPAEPTTPPRIFISYFREDCASQAGRLRDNLKYRSRFDAFLDVDAIPVGVPFAEYYEREISNCDLVIVMIGDDWLTLEDDHGKPKITNAQEHVHQEIRGALKRKVPLLPVLVEGVEMPKPHQLPESLTELAGINAAKLREDSWSKDYDTIEGWVSSLSKRAADPPSS